MDIYIYIYKVLDVDFPHLSNITFHTPTEHMKRVGHRRQSKEPPTPAPRNSVNWCL